jgi:putative ABC transport system substrate-binding protein
MSPRTERRAFIMLLGGAVAAPLPLAPRAGHAQQPAMPVVGWLDPRSPDAVGENLRGFHRGLKESGYVEGENVTIVHRWAENQIDRLPELAAELVRRRVAVIAATGAAAPVLAAKAATSTIPIVFIVGEDPVKLGLVASLARPGGNLTGINLLNIELSAKRLELLRELVPAAARIAVLVNPSNVTNTESTLKDVASAAPAMGLQLQVLNASTGGEIDTAFDTLARERPDALFVGSDPYFASRRVQLANSAAHHSIPMSSGSRLIADAGGLMSYGSNAEDAVRQVGVYIGRILKGARPADLPVMQSSKFELVINAQTARMLRLTVPANVLASADVVIE